jgi:transposase InsO family protein
MLVVGMAMVFCFLFYISQFASAVSGLFVSRRVTGFHGRRKWEVSEPPVYRFAKKPDWVPQEIIRMKALMPHSGCRTLAASFNRRFAHKAVSVGRTYVNETIRKHEYEIRVLRKKLKHRKPRSVPINRVWAMDLTGKQDSTGQVHNILGLVEHGSRANLCLHGLRDKASITLLRHLLDAIEKYGKPTFLRTDNEAVFTSRLFRFGLWLLGIGHQRTDKGCPWMNGRIERLFGTLKGKLRLWEIDSLEQLNNALVPFRFWYDVQGCTNIAGAGCAGAMQPCAATSEPGWADTGGGVGG